MQAQSSGVVSPVFVGRQRELTLVRQLLERAAEREPALVLVTGEAGVGKTRFVDEVAGFARDAGMQVLAGHCVPMGTDGLPLAPVAEALRELVRGSGRGVLEELSGPARELVARLVPVPGAADDRTPVPTSQLMELVLDLVERLSEARPLLLIVEDLQWADRSTLELVAFLAQNVRGVATALLTTYRSDEVDRRHPLRVLLTTWERNRAITRVELARFGWDEVRAQLTAILGMPPDWPTLDVVFERSEGNAFLAEETLSMVRSGDPRRLPSSLKDVLLARADRLTEAAQQILRLAAVAGRTVPERLLVAVSGLAESGVLAAVRETVDAHLLVVDEAGYGYRFRHALARDAVYDDLLPGERVRLHTAYAEALARDPALLRDTDVSVAASLAHHAYAALDLPRALEASVVAGREAMVALAPREALAQFERALQIWPRVPAAERPADVDQAQALWLAGEAAYQTGEMDRARALLDEALADLPADASPERRAGMLQTLALAHRDLGRNAAAITLLKRALDGLPADASAAVRAEVLAALSNTLMREVALDEAAEYGERAVAAARQAGLPQVEANAGITVGYSRALLDAPEAGVAAIHAAIELALGGNQVAIAVRGYINLSDLLEALGRSVEAVHAAEAGLELTDRFGLRRTLGTYLSGNLAESLLHLGEWHRASRLVDDALAASPEGVFEASAQIIRAELALLEGDLDACASALERIRTVLIEPDDQFSQPLASLDADRYRTVGDYERARAVAAAALDSRDEKVSLRYVWPVIWTGIRSEVERAQAGVGPALVSAPFVELIDSLRTDTPPSAAYRTLAAAELGRLDGSADWATPISAWRELRWPWLLAYSLMRHAEQQLGAGERTEARAALQESFALASRLGARPLLDEIEQVGQRGRLDLGSESVPTDSDPLAALGLTSREREVLLLLAAGRSNPEIARDLYISPKTASVHVSNILAKLGLSSRVQAAGLVHKLGLTPDPAT